MDKDRKEVIRPPLKWQERIEDLLHDDMPDAPYFAAWVSSRINWNIPVVNPWDYSKRYTIQSAPFNPHWIHSMVKACEESLKLSKEHPDVPMAWFIHKQQLKDCGKIALRSFDKMKYYRFLEPCPAEALLSIVPFEDKETGEVFSNTYGRYQPTEFMFAFLTNKMRVPKRIHTFKGQLIGMSEGRISVSDAVVESLGYSDLTLGESGENKCALCESNKDLYLHKYINDETEEEVEDYHCKECVSKLRDTTYNELIIPFKKEIVAMRRVVGDKPCLAQDIVREWNDKFVDYYQPSRDGITVDSVVDPAIGTRGSIVLPEDGLRRFLNKREKRRRQLKEEE